MKPSEHAMKAARSLHPPECIYGAKFEHDKSRCAVCGFDLSGTATIIQLAIDAAVKEATEELVGALAEADAYFVEGCWCKSGGGGHSEGRCIVCVIKEALAKHKGE